MYKIKDKYKEHIAKYAWTKLDINGVYSLKEWTDAGFKTTVLESAENGYGDEPPAEYQRMMREVGLA